MPVLQKGVTNGNNNKSKESVRSEKSYGDGFLSVATRKPGWLVFFFFSPASVLAFAEDGTCFPAFKKVSRFGNAPRHSK